ncbi:MAG: ester cyclase [Acidimicrobiia bacterium]|nr:ester cyclase [Acidimicrobiia bacterium]
MSTERNKDVVRRAAETFNALDRDAFLANYASELVVHVGEGVDPVIVTPDQHWAAVLAWNERFEGFTESIQQMVAEGDHVFLRSRYSGVHQGEWRGVPPTGKHVEWDAWQILRFEDGLIAEERLQMDLLDLFEQLGAIDPPR